MDYLIILFNLKPSWKLLNNNELEFPVSEVAHRETHTVLAQNSASQSEPS